MPQLLFLKKIRKLSYSVWIGIILCLIGVIQLFAAFGIYNYQHIDLEFINKYLYKAVTPDLVKKANTPDCEYEDILSSTRTINTWELPKNHDDFVVKGLVNGSYVPERCNPLFSVAIIVTYRNRQKQLDMFLPYIHNFLRKQRIHYRIYLVEQQDETPWNKGALYNIGAKHAIADKFPCLIFHDVDLFPLDDSNLYVCLNEPRHISASIDKFRFVLPYKTLVGGVISMRSDQFIAINGFSNKFILWGGEDDDFALRLKKNELNILRFPQNMSQYSMLVHKQETINLDRNRMLSENSKHLTSDDDGLSSVRKIVTYTQIKVHTLFILVGVKLKLLL